MRIVLPMDSEDIQNANLTKLDDVKFWIQINVEDGMIKESFTSTHTESFKDFSECVVVSNDNEYVWPFMELSMLVLVAHTQKSVEDIVEAYLFKELHDLAY